MTSLETLSVVRFGTIKRPGWRHYSTDHTWWT